MLDSLQYQIIGWISLVVGGAAFAYNATQSVRSPNKFERLNHLSTSVALLYPVGMGFKLLQVGPEFARFHLTDIGFPVMLGMGLAFIVTYVALRNPSLGKYDRYRVNHRFRMPALLVALLLSYGYEAMVGYVYRSNPGISVSMVGNFDWADMAMYTLGAAIAFWSYRRYGIEMEAYIAEDQRQAHEASEARRADKRARKAAGRRKRRTYTATNRRGGRR